MNVNILEKAIEKYGKTAQTLMFFEEVAELEKELCKNNRGEDNITQITEEIADVLIMLEQVKMMYGIESDFIDYFIDFKLERLEKRMEE